MRAHIQEEETAAAEETATAAEEVRTLDEREQLHSWLSYLNALITVRGCPCSLPPLNPKPETPNPLPPDVVMSTHR
jgi:hypothetical protein